MHPFYVAEHLRYVMRERYEEDPPPPPVALLAGATAGVVIVILLLALAALAWAIWALVHYWKRLSPLSRILALVFLFPFPWSPGPLGTLVVVYASVYWNPQRAEAPCVEYQSKTACEAALGKEARQRTTDATMYFPRRCRWRQPGGGCENLPTQFEESATFQQAPVP